MRYEAWTTVDGCEDDSSLHDTYGDATKKANDFADELKASDATTWEVFILPHYCDGDEGGCECVQWLTDHRPYLSDDRSAQRDFMQYGY